MTASEALTGQALPASYSRRLVTAHPPVEAAGRTYKVYGLFADVGRRSEFPDTDTLRREIDGRAAKPHPNDHGVGFVIRHLGRDGDYLLISEWHGGDMLRHRVSGTELGGRCLAPLPVDDLVACVWELEVIRFERDAWVRTVLAASPPAATAFEGYLGERMSGWV